MTIEVYYGKTLDGEHVVNSEVELPVRVEPRGQVDFELKGAGLGVSRFVKIMADAANRGGFVNINLCEGFTSKREDLIIKEGETISRFWVDSNVGFMAKHIK